ncbi:MAG TPA: hypothetical protein DIT95_22065, partial [Arenibacter sp.]|nr:hypothetical protein [Arenibacter sp.]
MKSISTIRIEIKNIWKVGLMLLVIATILSYNKDDDPEMEDAHLAESSQELLIGKWVYNVT